MSALPAWAALFETFRRMNVLVVGDMMLDRFIWGSVRRISPEAPVPVVEVERESVQPGGASNVVNNIGALGARACMAGVVGDDADGEILRQELGRAGVDTTAVVADRGSRTTVKTRIVAHSLASSQQMVRVDRERPSTLPESVAQELREAVAKESGVVDAVILSDYNKGVLRPGLVEAIREVTRPRGIPVVADAKPPNLPLLHGITGIQINLPAAEQVTGSRIQSDEELERAGRALLERSGSRFFLITLGARGMALFEQNQPTFRLPALEVTVYDQAGAGDTVISALTLALAAGASPEEAAELASLAAGTVVRKLGVATASPDEIMTLYRELKPEGGAKG